MIIGMWEKDLPYHLHWELVPATGFVVRIPEPTSNYLRSLILLDFLHREKYQIHDVSSPILHYGPFQMV